MNEIKPNLTLEQTFGASNVFNTWDSGATWDTGNWDAATITDIKPAPTFTVTHS